mgnify:CR=1 FL=1
MVVKEAIYLVPMSHIDILFLVFCLEICIFEVETNEENQSRWGSFKGTHNRWINHNPQTLTFTWQNDHITNGYFRAATGKSTKVTVVQCYSPFAPFFSEWITISTRYLNSTWRSHFQIHGVSFWISAILEIPLQWTWYIFIIYF